jgi:hypothetical protein
MKTKIIPVDRGSYFALEERTAYVPTPTDHLHPRTKEEEKDEAEAKGKDNEPVRVIGRGFVPYLMLKREEIPALKALFMTTNKEVTPTEKELFNSYFDHMSQLEDITQGIFPRPTDEEIKAEFRPIHAKNECEEFENLPSDLKQEYGSIFGKYLTWLKTSSMEQAEDRRELSRRAQAIYILLLEENGKGHYKYSKSRVEQFACDKWKLTKSKPHSVYEAFRKIKSDDLEKVKKDFWPDYKIALRLYSDDYPELKTQ